MSRDTTQCRRQLTRNKNWLVVHMSRRGPCMRSADPVRPGSIVICTGLPEPQVNMMLVYVLLNRYIARYFVP